MVCSRKNRGNILFLILLAVVLFAALAYAVTASLRGGGKDASTERFDLYASQLIQAASLLEQNMARAMLVNDIKEYGFDLSGTDVQNGANGTCTSTNCRMITGSTSGPMPEGGGVTIPKMPSWASASPNESDRRMRPMIVTIPNVGTSAEEVIWTTGFLNRQSCEAINKALNLSNINLALGDTIGGDTSLRNYSGTLSSLPATGAAIGDIANGTAGLRSFCFYNGSWEYVFLHVLIAR